MTDFENFKEKLLKKETFYSFLTSKKYEFSRFGINLKGKQ